MVKYDNLKEWQGGNSFGYFDVDEREIHILNGAALETLFLIHENVHLARRDKVTFRIAMLTQMKPIRNFLFTLILAFAILMPLSGFIPFLFCSGITLASMFCGDYEEHKAWATMRKTLRNKGEC